jgi:hypothetical protein
MGFRSVTFFDDPLQSIRTGQIARVPILLGSMEDDGTVFASFFPNVSAFYANQFGSLGAFFLPPNLTTLYPGLIGTPLVSAVIRDVWFLWCALRLLWVEKLLMLLRKPSKIMEWCVRRKRDQERVPIHIRYAIGNLYTSFRVNGHPHAHLGATFADFETFPNMGAYHGSECESQCPGYNIGTLAQYPR